MKYIKLWNSGSWYDKCFYGVVSHNFPIGRVVKLLCEFFILDFFLIFHLWILPFMMSSFIGNNSSFFSNFFFYYNKIIIFFHLNLWIKRTKYNAKWFLCSSYFLRYIHAVYLIQVHRTPRNCTFKFAATKNIFWNNGNFTRKHDFLFCILPQVHFHIF